LDAFPDVYSFRTELQPALVFIRSHQDGTVTQEGFDWLSQQVERGARWLADCKFTGLTAPEHPLVIKRGGVQAHSRAMTTRNGRTMVEWLQVVGRNRESVESFVRDVRQKERDGFFVRPVPY